MKLAAGRVRFDGDAKSYRRAQEVLEVDPEQTQREIDNFARLADQGDAVPTDEVELVTGRPAIPFATFVSRAAAAGAWRREV